MKERRLKFIGYGLEDTEYKIYNSKKEYLGWVQKTRVGSYMHWCLHTIEHIYWSAGCLDEVREFMKNPEKYKEKYFESVE